MRERWVALSLLALLSACGGGGGGGSSSGGPVVTPPSTPPATPPSGPSGSNTPPPDQTPTDPGAPAPAPVTPPSLSQVASPSSFETAEYNANWGLGAIHASSAYALGASGQGVTVGVIDTGVSNTNPDVASALSPASTDVVDRPSPDPNGTSQHGTWVASVIGARQNGAGTMGVAYNSTILGVRADAAGSCIGDSCSFNYSDLATATNYAVAHGAKILNYSLGGTDAIDASFQTALQNAAASQHILVFAAGNDNGGAVLNPASFAATAASQGVALAVGAVGPNNQIASFSAVAGSAMDHFLVAPGVNVGATGFNGTLYSVNGTSFSAPTVSGAAAVVWGAAPYLTAKQVVDLLLDTATDLGAPGVDAIYGHGLLNLQGALSPQGTPQIATGTAVGGPSVAAATSSLTLGAAFGDALVRSAALGKAVVFDSYGRPFSYDLSASLQRPNAVPSASLLTEPQLGRRVQQVAGPGVMLSMQMSENRSFTSPTDSHGHVDAAAASFDLGEGRRIELSQGYGLTSAVGLGRDEPFLGRDAFRSPFLGLAGQGSAVAFGQGLGEGQWLRFGASGPSAVPIDQAGLRQPLLSQDQMINPVPPADLPDVQSAQRRQAFVAEYGRRFDGGARVALQAGGLNERGSVLDTSGQGAFATNQGSAFTRFAGLTGSLPLSASTDLYGLFNQGWTVVQSAGATLLHDFQGVSSQSMGLGLTSHGFWREADRVSLSVNQPLRVTGGSALLDLPVGRTMDGTVIRAQQRLGLEPSGREVDVELDYGLPLGLTGDLSFTALTQNDPGHDATAGMAETLGMRYHLTW